MDFLDDHVLHLLHNGHIIGTYVANNPAGNPARRQKIRYGLDILLRLKADVNDQKHRNDYY